MTMSGWKPTIGLIHPSIHPVHTHHIQSLPCSETKPLSLVNLVPLALRLHNCQLRLKILLTHLLVLEVQSQISQDWLHIMSYYMEASEIRSHKLRHFIGISRWWASKPCDGDICHSARRYNRSATEHSILQSLQWLTNLWGYHCTILLRWNRQKISLYSVEFDALNVKIPVDNMLTQHM